MTNLKDISNIFSLEGKTAIVTGGKQGMGRTHALILAKAGAKVVVSDISKDDCQIVVDEIKKEGGEAIAVKCDISKKEEVAEMIELTKKEFGSIDILVNNAGICDFKDFFEISEEDWNKTIDINLKGYFLCSQLAGEVMKEQGGGVIVHIGSVAMGQVGIGFPNLVPYVASKGGIGGMTEAMAVDLAQYNIRVNAIAPGMIDTPMIDPIKEDKETIEGAIAKLPMKRVGEPMEISKAVLFLASDASSYMTGAVVNVDGGWLAA